MSERCSFCGRTKRAANVSYLAEFIPIHFPSKNFEEIFKGEISGLPAASERVELRRGAPATRRPEL